MSEHLTEREVAVLIELMSGKSNRVIAKKLYISLSTVKAHVSSVFQKLNVKNRVEAAVKGVFLLDLNYVEQNILNKSENLSEGAKFM